MKIVKFIQRNPISELPTVEIPSEEENNCRRCASEHEFHKHVRTKQINRLHSVFTRVGITHLTRKDLKGKKSRIALLQ